MAACGMLMASCCTGRETEMWVRANLYEVIRGAWRASRTEVPTVICMGWPKTRKEQFRGTLKSGSCRRKN